jgi:hypothetical protein
MLHETRQQLDRVLLQRSQCLELPLSHERDPPFPLHAVVTLSADTSDDVITALLPESVVT